MKEATLVFIFKDNQILLAMKKRGFGEGHWNGTGGKIEVDESPVQAAIRETQEEIGVTSLLGEQAGKITFRFMDGFELLVHVWRTDTYSGEPKESEEMRPLWFPLDAIPYDQMWDDDKYWLPLLIEGKKFEAEFWFDEHKKVSKHNIELK